VSLKLLDHSRETFFPPRSTSGTLRLCNPVANIAVLVDLGRNMVDTTSNEGLLSSLSALYGLYKAGTAVLINWLLLKGATDPSNNNGAQSEQLPVRRILELAQAAAKRQTNPPPNIKLTFKSVLVNRRALNQYYEGHSNGSKLTQESTDRHKFFNETLAQAYDALFPMEVDQRQNASPTARTKPTEKQPLTSTSKNLFDVLSDVIEQEPDFDPAYVAEPKVKTQSQPQAEIEDDRLDELIHIHQYVYQFEWVINTANKVWTQARNGDLPISLAGCLTNIAHHHIRFPVEIYGAEIGHHDGLTSKYMGVVPPAGDEGDTAIVADGMPASRLFNSFSFSWGNNLMWSRTAYKKLEEMRQNIKDYLGQPDKHKLHECLWSPSEEKDIKQRFLATEYELLQMVDALEPGNNSLHAPESFAFAVRDRFRDEVKAIEATFRGTMQISQVDVRDKNLLLRHRVMVDPKDKHDAGHILFQIDQTVPLMTDMEDIVRNPGAPLKNNIVFGKFKAIRLILILLHANHMAKLRYKPTLGVFKTLHLEQ
jgi:hypothetical protein